jgi:glycosyltransferase involved in cell wall biosynthesis
MADSRISRIDDAAAPPVGHVLHVADREVCLRFGPMLTQVWQGLCATGWRVALLTDDREMLARLAGTPVEGHGVPHLGGWWAGDLDAYLQAHFRPRPDLAHLWGTAGLWRLQRWSRRDNVPLLVHALGAAHVTRLMRGRLRDDQHLAVAAQPLAVPLLTRFPMAASRCQIIPPGIAPPLRVLPARPAERTFSVLCVGPLAEQRGLEVLIDAVAELRRKGGAVHVALIGAGPGVSAVWRRIHARQVHGCVLLSDEPRLWEQVLPEVDACVVPGTQPELTIVPLLAMALGKLVIASRDQPAEWFVEDRTAWQFTPGSAVELAYLLARAIEQPQRAQETGRLAGEYVRAHHSVREMVERLVGLYGRLCTWRSAATVTALEKNRGERGTE